jgi:hypothetical protein
MAVPLLTMLGLAGLVLPGSAGAWALYPALGLFPGLAAACLLPLEGGAVARLALGLAVAPLVSAVAGWALVAAGVPLPIAARAVAVAGWAAWAALAWRGPRVAKDGAREPGARFALLWALGAALTVGLTLFCNPYLRVRSDAWTHAGIVWEILERGIPPQDPRFAGMPLNYVWFFNLFIAMASTLRGGDPFVFMAIFNAANMAATMLVVWTIGRRLWGVPAAAGCAMLTALGFNAGAWLLWPLNLLRALLGRNRGWPEVKFALDQVHLTDWRVMNSLGAPSTYMANFLDKFLVGTALNYAYVMMLLYLWALVTWLATGRRATLAWAAASACGMMMFHGVVGMSVLPVMIGTLSVAALAARRWPWLPAPSRLAAFGLASLAGAAIVMPYTISISRGWAPSRTGLHATVIRFDPWMLWTLATALGVTAWIARRPIRRVFSERRPDGALLALFMLAMGLFATLVRLPLWNQTKFVQQAFMPLALLGGPALVPEWRAWAARRGPAIAGLAFALVFAAPPALTLFGFLSDRSGRTAPELNPAPGEPALYAWIRRETPPDAVFIDRDFCPLLMVRAGRQLLLGSRLGPEIAAFPLDQLEERRAVMADLYGPVAALDGDAAVLRRLERPVYVLYREKDGSGPSPARALARAPSPFRSVYDRDGFVLYRLTITPAATREGSP